MSGRKHRLMPDGLRLVGHKGADLIAPGNTPASFAAAVEAGVDTIEIDVLWTRDGHPKAPAAERTPLVIAHDWHDAERRRPLTLTEALDLFLEPPLDRVEIDLDIKLPGREEEIVEAVVERDLLGRAMVSTMELSTLARIRELEPALPARLDLSESDQGLGLEALGAAADAWRRWSRCAAASPGSPPARCRRWGSGRSGSTTRSSSPRLAEVARSAGVELIAWTVDDLDRMRKLVATGVTGICSNDPRLFASIS